MKRFITTTLGLSVLFAGLGAIAIAFILVIGGFVTIFGHHEPRGVRKADTQVCIGPRESCHYSRGGGMGETGVR